MSDTMQIHSKAKRSQRRYGLAALVGLIGLAPWQIARSQSAAETAVPPEELRFGNKEFREGLKQRGLSEMLELHLADFPPSTESEALLLMRDMRLARYSDPSRSLDERRAALADANDLLARLILVRPDDPRRFHWRIELAESLLLREAELPAASVLFHGTDARERSKLARIARAALEVLTTLREEIRAQYDRIDAMPLDKLEAADTDALLESLDAIGPRGEYLMLWAQFYDAATRDATDPIRPSRLQSIAESIAADPDWIATPHEVSGAQVQLLLLAGMTHRRLANHARAAEYLDEVDAVAGRLSDPAEFARLGPHIQLARLERIRADADSGAYHEALRRLAELREDLADERDENFYFRLAAAGTEREVLRRRADEARRQGHVDAAEIYRKQSWHSMQRLLDGDRRRRDRVLAAVYQTLPPDVDPAQLDPFERCALIAGRLFDSGETPDKTESTRLLHEAASVAESTLPMVDDANSALRPVLLFNLAVAQFRLGHAGEAANRFLELGRAFPAYPDAQSALTLAVQISARALEDGAASDSADLDAIYGDSLAALIDRFPDSEAARYWRFHYAQWLDEQGRFEQAAEHFAAVPGEHELALEAAFLRVRSLARDIETSAESTDAADKVRKKVDAFHEAALTFRRAVAVATAPGVDPQRRASAEDFSIRADLIRAEVLAAPRVGRARDALEVLAAIAARPSDSAEFIARRWNLQLRVEITLQRFDEAGVALANYVQSDPERAGESLQILYDSLVGGFVERLIARSGGSKPPAAQADLSVRLAEQIDAWTRTATGATERQRRLSAAQVAESHLHADRLSSAKRLYESLVPGAESAAPSGIALLDPVDLRLRIGLAETTFRLGDHPTALRLYNPLAVELSPDEPLRWHALLRDLQCRTATGADPRGVLRVIDQQRQLFPDLGGRDFAERIAALYRENEQRLPQPPP